MEARAASCLPVACGRTFARWFGLDEHHAGASLSISRELDPYMSQSPADILESLSASGLVSDDDIRAVAAVSPSPSDAQSYVDALVRRGTLTTYQAKVVSEGKQQTLVFGEYIVLDRIGAGGMGEVFKGIHKRMKRIVAVKRLPAQVMHSAATIQRFYREVEAAAKLMHPNIVAAHDAGEAHGSHFLVMEYVDGPDLSHLLRQQGRLPIPQAIDIILQAARGLAYAHSKGIIHRDIKPANMLIAGDGTVKLLDMGLARIEHELSDSASSSGELTLTQEGRLMGTVEYMAPEQAADAHSADARADIYSLGCTLYRCLTGKLPYSGTTSMQKIIAHREQPIPLLKAERPEVPAELEAIYMRMVAKRAEDRFQSMREVIAALDALTPLPLREGPGEGQVSRSSRTSASAHHPQSPTPAPQTSRPTPAPPSDPDAPTTDAQTNGAAGTPIGLSDLAMPASATSSPVTIDPATIPVARRKGWRKAEQRRQRREAVGQFLRRRRWLLASAAVLLVALVAIFAIPGSKKNPSNEVEATIPVQPVKQVVRTSITPADGWVDVLALIDPILDKKINDWTLEGSGLRNQTGEALVGAPLVVTGGYQLQVRCKRLDGNNSLNFILPVGTKWTHFILAGVSDREGQSWLIGLTGLKDGFALVNNREVQVDATISVDGDNARVRIDVDGRACIDWAGSIASLPMETFGSTGITPPASFMGFGAIVDHAEFSLVRLKMLAGEAKLLRPQGNLTPPPTPITNTVNMKLVWIKPGSFDMGSPASEAGRDPGEVQHRVTLTKGFYMGTTEVTQAQWKVVMGNDPSAFKGDDLPVESVSWDDTVAFCRKLSEKEGKTYRLPTEAEWEYTCRAGTSTAFHSGNVVSDLAAVAWYGGVQGNSDNKTHPVGSKKANAWGLYDMHGNVWEWCHDWLDNYPSQAIVDPSGPSSGTSRIQRGGGWVLTQGPTRSAHRHRNAPEFRGGDVGFRVVLDYSDRDRKSVIDVEDTPGPWIDLLPLIDLSEDALAGWSMQGGKLALAAQPSEPAVYLPVEPRGSYRLRIGFTRQPDAQDGLLIAIPVGSTRVRVDLDHTEKHYSGLELLKGLRAFDASNPTRVADLRIVTGRRYLAEVTVRLKGQDATVETRLDNRLVVSWTGPISDLSGEGWWWDSTELRPAIGASKSSYVVDQVQFQSLDGSPHFTRTAEQAAKPQRAVAAKMRWFAPYAVWGSFGMFPDGTRVVVNGSDHGDLKVSMLEIIDLKTGESVAKLGKVEGQPWSNDVSPDGRYIALGHLADFGVELYEVSTGQRVWAKKLPERNLQQVRFSFDGSEVFATTNGITAFNLTTGEVMDTRSPVVGGGFASFDQRKDGLIALGNAAHGFLSQPHVKQGRQFTEGIAEVRVRFSFDGRYVAAGGAKGEIAVFDIEATGTVFKHSGHTAYVNAVAFSPNGKLLATAGDDHWVKIWDWKNGKLLTQIRHPGAVQQTRFSVDGRMLITGAYGGGPGLWCFDLTYHDPTFAEGLPPATFGNASAESLKRGLVGHWTFEEGEGDTARDSSGLKNEGRLTFPGSATIWSRETPPMLSTSRFSLQFSGNKGFVNLDGDRPSLSITEALTLSAWMKTDLLQDGARIVDKNSTSYSMAIELNGEVKLNLTVATCSSKRSVSDNKWHHVAATYDGRTMRVYVDGTIDNTSEAAGALKANNHGASIGGRGTADSFKGWLDDVRIYNRALTDEEIKLLSTPTKSE
ncbi:MAG: SUMF1/EgtB/PvdO family nonheme iron enzyme [Phycisphaeraceae bacterium]